MNTIPIEFSIGGVYMPPLLMASILGVVSALMLSRLLNSYRLSKYFFYPPLVFVALSIIFTMIYGVSIVPF
ncbi:MAG: DUF1656 domain-containing protein, partial [Gammaproteobacteria bacterium]|nr:DUF1656 domain-containing protein [Gammaproteobacteria bacterium]